MTPRWTRAAVRHRGPRWYDLRGWWHWWKSRHERDTERLLHKFMTEGPGSIGACPLCSYYRYGIFHGHDAEEPGPHYCPEGRSAPIPEPEEE